ncbi:hypothetical protein [Sphingomonas sp. RS2018]
MSGAPPVPSGNTSPYPLHQPAHAPVAQAGPVLRTPEPVVDTVPLAALAFFGGAILLGGAAIALALSGRE